MRRMLIAGAMALGVAGQAFAADLPPAQGPAPRAPATYVPTTEPAYNWSGFYLGVNGGYGFGTSSWSFPGFSSGSFDVSGGVAGGTIGANFQMNQFVFGLEGDLDWSDMRGTSSVLACGPFSCQTANTWLGTVRGRLGFAMDRILLYGAGGAAFGNIQASLPGSGFGTDTTTNVGWTAGAGIEGALGYNLTARLEYLYVDLGDGSCPNVCGGAVTIPFKANIVRAGIDYKFNGF